MPQVIKDAATVSAYNRPAKVAAPVLTGKYQLEGYTLEKYFVRGGGDYVIPYVLYLPETPVDKVVLYIHPMVKGRCAKLAGNGMVCKERRCRAGTGFAGHG